MAQETTQAEVLPADSQGRCGAFGFFSLANPAATTAAALPDEAHEPRVVAWGGWLDGSARPGEGAFPRDFRAWSAEGWEALKRTAPRMAAGLRDRGTALCLRPAAGCVLGDPQACLTFFRDPAHAGIELLIDLPSMLTPEMLGHLEDHADRAFHALGVLESAAGAVLAAPVAHDGRGGVMLKPLSDHPLQAEVLLAAWRASPLRDRPVLVTDPRDLDLFA